jgi:hypothetical protein
LRRVEDLLLMLRRAGSQPLLQHRRPLSGGSGHGRGAVQRVR